MLAKTAFSIGASEVQGALLTSRDGADGTKQKGNQQKMSNFLGVAGVLMILLGLVHSVLGEMLIFRHVRRGKAQHAGAIDLLPQRRWDALWSSWHLVTLLGVGLGSSLLLSASVPATTPRPYLSAIAVTFSAASVFWVLGTRGKHPAWIVFAVIAAVMIYPLLANPV